MLAGRVAISQTNDKQVSAEAQPGVISVDIPAQPLATALQAFADASGIGLFYESSRTLGRMSSPVRGVFSAEEALRRMLAGTGFTIASFERGAITVLPPGSPPGATELAQVKSRAAAFTPYFAVLQSTLHRAFCQTTTLRTEPAELVVRLWISPTGAISFIDLLSSTGSAPRDKAYIAALQGVVIDRPPPAAMPQPVTLMILPRGQEEAAACAGSGAPSKERS